MLENILRRDYLSSDCTTSSQQDDGYSVISALTEVQSFLERHQEPEFAVPPMTLFGRERPEELLEAALERCFSVGGTKMSPSELVVIQGRSGCGKTTLAESLRPKAIGRHATYGLGKFSPCVWSNHLPYAAIVTALTTVMEQILEREDELEDARHSVRTILGDNIYLLTPLLPNLAQLAGICGYESSTTHGMVYALDRMKQSFCDLLRAIATSVRPIVLVLDDLHYSDAASVDVLKAMMVSDSHHVLMIVTTTSSLDDETTTLGASFRSSSSLRCTDLHLTDLSDRDAYFVTASLLQEDSLSISDLSDICFSKTNGNPLFLQHFLALLQKKELLVRKQSGGMPHWIWDTGKVRDEAISSGNVIDVITQFIGLLHPLIQQFLQIAACVGVDIVLLEILFDAMRHQQSTANAIHEILEVAAALGYQFQRIATELICGAVEQQISMETMEESVTVTHDDDDDDDDRDGVSVPNLPSIQVAVCLTCCTKMGLIQAEGDEKYQFSHDLIQQAVEETIGDLKADKHLAIGQILRQHEKFNPGNPSFFCSGVDQLNAGSTRIVQNDDIVSLISLNVEAAVIAAEQSAFVSAQRYLHQALELQPNHTIMWEMEYDLMLECSNLTAEMEMACGNYDEAISHTNEVLQHADLPGDKVQATFTKISSLIALGRINEARNIILQSLLELGNKFPAKPQMVQVKKEVLRTTKMMNNMTDEQILGLNPIEVALRHTEVKLLCQLSWCSFRLGDGETLAMAAFGIVHLTIVNGFSDSAPFAFAVCGLVHSYFNNFKELSHFASLSVNGLKRVANTFLKALTLHIVSSFTIHWNAKLAKVHLRSVQALELAKLSGDSHLTNTCALTTCIASFLQGRESLVVLIESIQATIGNSTVHDYKDTATNIYRICLQAATNLSSHYCSFPYKLTGETMAEDIMLQDVIEKQNSMTVYALWNVKLQLCAFFDNWQLAEEVVHSIGTNYSCLKPHFSHLQFLMLSALTLAIRFNETKKRKYRCATRRVMKELEHMVDNGAVTCDPIFALVLAEESSIGGDQQATMAAFDYAVRLFGDENHLNYQALANERAARNMMKYFPRDVATSTRYLLRARFYYDAWGASSKVVKLDNEFFHMYGGSAFPHAAILPK